MKEFLILFFTGLFFIITGIWALRRDKRLMKDAVRTTAKVVSYDEYDSSGGSERVGKQSMYTMNVTYTIWDGTVINAKEQSGNSHKKYEEGAYIDIQYSKEKSDFFIVSGDYTRKIAFVIITILGFFAIGLSGLILYNTYLPF